MNIKIEKDVPIPSLVSSANTGTSEVIGKMEVGDSFFLTGKSSRAHWNPYFRRQFGKGGYTTRAEKRNGVDGYRVWRIK